MQISILRGIYVDAVGEFRTKYPRNLVPVPTDTGISKGYLRPADGIVQLGAGPDIGRGGINWNGITYRVMGSKLVNVAIDGTVTVLGDVGSDGKPVTLDYSFDRLAIASNGMLFYWDNLTLQQVTDPDLGIVLDVRYVAGYFMTTDGVDLIVTDLDDPFSVNPLHYGSSEADPDPVVAVDELRNEAYAFNRYSIEVFENVGGDGFPFQVIEGAEVPRGVIGTYAYVGFTNTFAFVGSGRNEAPGVYLLVPGDTQKLSTREVDEILLTYGEAVLSTVIVEQKVDKNHELLLIHLPDQTLVFDATATAALGEQVWSTRTSTIVGNGIYRARNLVWCYDRWNCEDPTTAALGYLSDSAATHFGATVGYEFGVLMIYNGGNGAIVHELELVALPGRLVTGSDPTVWTSYSLDGELYSQERPTSGGKLGERQKRIAWRTQGTLKNYRNQRFRWTSDMRMSVARLEAQLEPLFTRPVGQ